MPSLPVRLTVSGGASDSRDGILGNQVLSRFNQVYDFQGEQVWLQANQKMNQPTFPNRTGPVLPAGCLVEHAAKSGAIHITSVHTKADDSASVLIHHDHYPMAL